MITYLLGLAIKTFYVGVLGVVRVIFGPVWTMFADRLSSLLAMDGVQIGLGIYDMFVGIDFTVWAVGWALAVVVTMRLIKLIMGVVSKGV